MAERGIANRRGTPTSDSGSAPEKSQTSPPAARVRTLNRHSVIAGNWNRERSILGSSDSATYSPNQPNPLDRRTERPECCARNFPNRANRRIAEEGVVSPSQTNLPIFRSCRAFIEVILVNTRWRQSKRRHPWPHHGDGKTKRGGQHDNLADGAASHERPVVPRIPVEVSPSP